MAPYVKKNYKRCGAKSRQTGEPCRRPAMANGRCYLHGGKAPVGVVSTSFQHGRYSKYLPANLLARYEQSLNDPQILELVNEISLVDARISQRLDDIDKNEAASITWKELQIVWSRFTNAIRDGDQQKQQEHLRQLNDLVNGGAKHADLWYEVMNLVDNRRKLVDSEAKRMDSTRSNVTIEQALLLVSATISALKEIVYKYADPQTARSILVDASAKYKELIGPVNPPGGTSGALDG